MIGAGNRIHPAELTDDGEHLDHEVAMALAVARRLESELHATETTTPSSDFGGRVMAAIAREPRPRAVAFLAPLERRRSLGGLRESVALAWRVAIGATLPTRARASALAYVLALLLVAGSATTFAAYGAAGALGWFGTSPTLSPPATNPDATSAPTTPLGEPDESTEPSGSPEDSQEPGASGLAEPDDSGGADSTATPTIDDGTPSATSGDDHGGIANPTSSAQAPQTPKPSGTPKASPTPEPSNTPSPTSSSHG